jgi:hypothetical protein
MFRLIRVLAFLAKLAGPVAIASCTAAKTDSADSQGLALSQSDTGSSVNASVGQEITVTLQTVGPGQYSTPSVSADSIRFLGVSLPSVQNPGGVTQDFRFNAESVGTAVVTIPHSENGAEFEVSITVQ